MPRHNPHRHFGRNSVERELGDEGPLLVDVAVVRPHVKAIGGARRENQNVFPYDLRLRLRQLLQPGVVREAAVVDGRVVFDFELETGCWLLAVGCWGWRRRARRASRQRGVFDQSIVQPLAPAALEVMEDRRRRLSGQARRLSSIAPIRAHGVVGRLIHAADQRAEDFVRGAAVVERGDQRLDDRHRPVVRPRVAPTLQRMHLGDVPMRQHRRLVVVRAQVRAEWNFRQRRVELEVGRRIEDRVAAEDDQRLHGAVVHVGGELAKRFELIRRCHLDGVGHEHRRSDVAER